MIKDYLKKRSELINFCEVSAIPYLNEAKKAGTKSLTVNAKTELKNKLFSVVDIVKYLNNNGFNTEIVTSYKFKVNF